MIVVYVIIGIVIAYLIARVVLLKYENPVYQYRGEYQYSHHGDKKQYFTETVVYPTQQNDYSLVFLFFSGNPGYIRFYDRFLYHLSDIYDKKYTVIGVGQAGQFKSQLCHQKYFNLEQQIDHKIQYFKDLIQLDKYNNSKFVLIGHSFGCYTALKLLNQIDQNKIAYSILIHPAIERLIETKNGFLYHLMKLDFIFILLLQIFTLLTPMSFIRAGSLLMLDTFKHKKGEDVTDQAETIAQWIGVETFHSFGYLAKYQFEEITQLNESDISSQKDKMTVYYAKRDRWTPEEFKQAFKMRFEKHVEYKEDTVGLNHTFVIGGSRMKAEVVKKLLELKL